MIGGRSISGRRGGAFTRVAASTTPIISNISPSSGSESGGYTITVTLTGCAADATLKVDGVLCTSIVVTGTTQITGVVPAGTAGAVDVRVDNVGAGTSDTEAGAFTYTAAAGFGFDPAANGFTERHSRPWNTKAGNGTDVGTGALPTPVGGSEGWDATEHQFSRILAPRTDFDAENHALFRFPARVVPGGTTDGPGTAQTPGGGFGSTYSQVYTRTRLYLGPDFQNHTQGMKFFFTRSNSDGSNNKVEPIIGLLGATAPYRLHVALQGTEDDNRNGGTGNNGQMMANEDTTIADDFPTEEWVEVEVLYVMNSDYGVGDGVLRVWLNGVLALEYTDIRFQYSDTQSWYWIQSHWAMTWGGQGGTISPGFDIGVGPTSIWVKA